jgi:hypothetical protein
LAVTTCTELTRLSSARRFCWTALATHGALALAGGFEGQQDDAAAGAASAAVPLSIRIATVIQAGRFMVVLRRLELPHPF